MADVPEAAERLFELLEEEFAALKRRDVDHLEALQPSKLDLITRIAEGLGVRAGGAGSGTGVGPAEPPEPQLRSLLERCRNAHRRNETLLQHQLAAVRGALQALSSDEQLAPVETYDRMGQLRPGAARRGYSDA